MDLTDQDTFDSIVKNYAKPVIEHLWSIGDSISYKQAVRDYGLNPKLCSQNIYEKYYSELEKRFIRWCESFDVGESS